MLPEVNLTNVNSLSRQKEITKCIYRLKEEKEWVEYRCGQSLRVKEVFFSHHFIFA